MIDEAAHTCGDKSSKPKLQPPEKQLRPCKEYFAAKCGNFPSPRTHSIQMTCPCLRDNVLPSGAFVPKADIFRFIVKGRCWRLRSTSDM